MEAEGALSANACCLPGNKWNVRRHGGARPRFRRKIRIRRPAGEWHIHRGGIDEKTLRTRAVVFTSNDNGDAPMLPELPDQIPPLSWSADKPLPAARQRMFTCVRGGQWMHCVKLPGQRLTARDIDRQVAGFQIRMAVMDGYTAPLIPVTSAVG